MPTWFEDLQRLRLEYVDVEKRNEFDVGIWHTAVDKYAEPTHFILELLQNAEDQSAKRAVLRVDSDRIIFEHDGLLFTEQDVKNITGIGNTTKPTQPNKIGCFGIGFKSVFVATERPEIHSWLDGGPFSFAIRDLVVPELIVPGKGRPGWTRFELPLKPTVRATIVQSIRERMTALGPRVLLFLHSIEHLEWSCGDAGETFMREPGTDQTTVLRRRSVGGTPTESTVQYLVYRRDVPRFGALEGVERQTTFSARSLTVSVAFRLDANGDIVPEEQRTRLRVFFETQEDTGLFFIVHGPFLLTDNRANIKRAEPVNERLVDGVAALVADSLDDIRNRTLLTRTFLGVLPGRSDSLAAPWSKVREQVLDAMKSRPLVPTQTGSHETATLLRRGPAPLRAVLSDDALAMFFGIDGARWAVGGLRSQREVRFLDDLGIPEVTVKDFLSKLTELFARMPAKAAQWIDERTDIEIQRLYLLLPEQQLYDTQYFNLRGLPIVRLEDTRHVRGTDAFFAPDRSRVDERSDIALPLVSGAVLQHSDSTRIRAALGTLGVENVGETAYVDAILKSYIQPRAVDLAVHRSHITRFVELWVNSKDASLFRRYSFLLSDDLVLRRADQLYIDVPYEPTGLRHVYDGRATGTRRYPLWHGYADYRIESFVDFACKSGAHRTIPIQRTQTSSHSQSTYLQGAEGRRNTVTDEDYTMEDIELLLGSEKEPISRCIWNAMLEAPNKVLQAVYQPNLKVERRTAASSLVMRLRYAAWIPDRQGYFKQPCDITYDSLAEDFVVGDDNDWLTAINFAGNERSKLIEHQERLKVAQTIGVSDELLASFLAVPMDVRASFVESFVLAQRRSAELVEDALPAFPEHETSNPSRRAEKTAARAREASPKRFEMRNRQIRVPDTLVDGETKIYLCDMYTNEDGRMFCQSCQREMPFRLADGSYYFSAVECISDLDYELTENHLALCPVCAAKYLHANTTDTAELLQTLLARKDLSFQVKLAGEESTIRFVHDHRNDLADVLKALREISGIDKSVTP